MESPRSRIRSTSRGSLRSAATRSATQSDQPPLAPFDPVHTPIPVPLPPPSAPSESASTPSTTSTPPEDTEESITSSFVHASCRLYEASAVTTSACNTLVLQWTGLGPESAAAVASVVLARYPDPGSGSGTVGVPGSDNTPAGPTFGSVGPSRGGYEAAMYHSFVALQTFLAITQFEVAAVGAMAGCVMDARAVAEAQGCVHPISALTLTEEGDREEDGSGTATTFAAYTGPKTTAAYGEGHLDLIEGMRELASAVHKAYGGRAAENEEERAQAEARSDPEPVSPSVAVAMVIKARELLDRTKTLRRIQTQADQLKAHLQSPGDATTTTTHHLAHLVHLLHQVLAETAVAAKTAELTMDYAINIVQLRRQHSSSFGSVLRRMLGKITRRKPKGGDIDNDKDDTQQLEEQTQLAMNAKKACHQAGAAVQSVQGTTSWTIQRHGLWQNRVS